MGDDFGVRSGVCDSPPRGTYTVELIPDPRCHPFRPEGEGATDKVSAGPVLLCKFSDAFPVGYFAFYGDATGDHPIEPGGVPGEVECIAIFISIGSEIYREEARGFSDPETYRITSTMGSTVTTKDGTRCTVLPLAAASVTGGATTGKI